MKYLKEYESFNPKVNKRVLDYVELNKFNLPHLWNKDLSEDENIESMIKYFNEFPQEMENPNVEITKVSQNKSNSLRNMSPKVMNIGGVHDFKSF